MNVNPILSGPIETSKAPEARNDTHYSMGCSLGGFSNCLNLLEEFVQPCRFEGVWRLLTVGQIVLHS